MNSATAYKACSLPDHFGHGTNSACLDIVQDSQPGRAPLGIHRQSARNDLPAAEKHFWDGVTRYALLLETLERQQEVPGGFFLDRSDLVGK